MTWEVPKKVNGEIDHYILRAKALDNSANPLRNYCDHREWKILEFFKVFKVDF